jgi:hypothetical protein
MICNSEIGHKGRLGNALFQYAAVKGLAKLTNSVAVLHEDTYNRVWHEQECGLKYFKIKSHFISNSEFSQFTNTFYPNETIIPYNGRGFDSTFLIQPSNTLIFGHFENMKYFENVENEIREEYELIDIIKNEGSYELNKIISNYPKDTKIISIHLRLGDNNSINKPEISNKSSWIHTYIKNALEQFSLIKNKVFICFTGGARTSINDNSDMEFFQSFIKQYISNDIFFVSNNYIIDFSMLTQSDHIIILTFSTFIWWAAYLNNNKDKKIIVPKNDFFAKGTQFWHKDFIQL